MLARKFAGFGIVLSECGKDSFYTAGTEVAEDTEKREKSGEKK